MIGVGGGVGFFGVGFEDIMVEYDLVKGLSFWFEVDYYDGELVDFLGGSLSFLVN